MVENFSIQAPFFEIGPKAYLYGKETVALAVAADKAACKYNVDIIYTALEVDIPGIVAATTKLKVFAQHMDSLKPGRGIGMALGEALKEAGAQGTLLNHAESRMELSEINKTIKRADEVGLATLVCADTPEEACAIAYLKPNMILAESPGLIGGGVRSESDMERIAKTNEMIYAINPDIKVMHSAGINSGRDVYDVMASGADATGSTSGIIKAASPAAMIDEMICAVRQAWDERQKQEK
jgi:triosephosphate isomerase (TIM)